MPFDTQSANSNLPRGLSQLAVDLLVGVHVKSPLDEGERHLEGLHAELGAVLSDELQPLDPHEATVAGSILLQVLYRTPGPGRRATRAHNNE